MPIDRGAILDQTAEHLLAAQRAASKLDCNEGRLISAVIKAALMVAARAIAAGMKR